MLRSTFSARALMFAAASGFGAAAQAEVITFQSLESSGTGINFVSSYTEAGFTITSPQQNFGTAQTGNVQWYAGSTSLFNNQVNGETNLTKVGGGSFTLSSIDLSEVATFYTGPVSVTFTGTKSDLTTVSATFNLDQVFGFQTFNFSGFSDVTKVTWFQTPNYHQFDNITLNAQAESAAAAPLPGAATAGLSLLGGMAMRRSRREIAAQ